MRWRVVCGLAETIDTFCPTRRLSRLDLPVLGARRCRWCRSDASSLQLLEHRLGGFLLGALPRRAVPGRAHPARRRIRPRTTACAARPAWRPRGTRGSGLPRACSSSCRRVFASFSTLPGIEALEQRAEAPAAPPGARRRSRRRGRSRRTPPPAHRRGSRPGSAPAGAHRRIGQAEARRHLGERLLAHQARAQAGQLAFGRAAGSARRARRPRRSRARRRRGIPAARCCPRRGCGASAPARGGAVGERCPAVSRAALLGPSSSPRSRCTGRRRRTAGLPCGRRTRSRPGALARDLEVAWP